jgi:metal-responsive CopG/Arc/MetJ family transcriptional regulator
MIGARFPDALTEAIDKWAVQNGDIGRSEAMRRLVQLGLKAKGRG